MTAVKSNLIRVLALALFPASALVVTAGQASAVVTVMVERVMVVPSSQDQTVGLEVFATNPDAAENERLSAYVIALEAAGFTPGGVRFVIPPNGVFQDPTTHPYVFRAYPGNGPVDPSGTSDFDTAVFSAAAPGTGAEANISDMSNGFAKVDVFVPANTVGMFPIVIDPRTLVLGSNGPSITAVAGSGYVQVGPEPGCLGELVVAGVLALRRRRWA